MNYYFIDKVVLLYIYIKQFILNILYYDYIIIKLIEKNENNNLIYDISLYDILNINIKENYYIFLEKQQNNKLIKYCEKLSNIKINNIYKQFEKFSLDNNRLRNQVIEVDLNENITILVNKYFNEYIIEKQLVKNIYLSECNLFIDQLCNNDIKVTDTWLNEYFIKKPYNSELILNNF